ncbi:hypothetical protein Tco_1406698 [Tanacetum coccineum]
MKKTLKATVPNLILKLMNKEFNALNTLESRRVSREIMVINAKQLQTKVEKNATDISKLVELTTEIVRLMDLAPAFNMMAVKGEKECPQQSTPTEDVPLHAQGEQVDDKGKGIAQTFNDDHMKQLMPILEQGGSIPKLLNLHQFSAAREGPLTIKEAKAQMEEIKRLAELKADKEKTEKRLKKLMTLDELRAHVEGTATYEAKRARMLEEYNHCFIHGSNVKIKSNDQLLKNLKEKFQWVATQAKKLRISPPPELTRIELPSAEKKTNLKKGKIQNVIKKNSAEAKEMYNKLNIVIEARNDIVEARKIVLDNLDNLGYAPDELLRG